MDREDVGYFAMIGVIVLGLGALIGFWFVVISSR